MILIADTSDTSDTFDTTDTLIETHPYSILHIPSFLVILHITFLINFSGYIIYIERLSCQHWLLNITPVG